MKKIIWISSYPKSGNTWIRHLISNYFFNRGNKFNFQIADEKILMFPQLSLMKKLVNKKSLIENPFNISRYWLDLQKNVNVQDGNVVFFKNHNALISIEKNDFTNMDLTLGAVYVVRDPRDVVISYAHYKNESYDKIISDLCDDKLFYNINSIDNFPYIEIIGSWSYHYKSWKFGMPNMPRIIIKYEDLLNDCIGQFSNTIDFLSKILNHKKDNSRIKFSVDNSEFSLLQKSEKKFGMKTNQGKGVFFRSGKSGQWKDILSNSQIKRIENSCKKAMKELNYL